METIEIQILAQDVNNAKSFDSNTDCVVAMAVKRQLNVEDVLECLDHVYINNIMYKHDKYGYVEYFRDRQLAHDSPNDTLIRTITLNIKNQSINN
jgi:hypothetical protein